jgi:hypothetical protein
MDYYGLSVLSSLLFYTSSLRVAALHLTQALLSITVTRCFTAETIINGRSDHVQIAGLFDD